MTAREDTIKRIERVLNLTHPKSITVTIPRLAAERAVSMLKEQEAKTGHWTISEYEYLDCSCCGNSYYTGCDSTEEAKMRLKKGFYFNYCPYCGAKMGNEVKGR